MALEPVPDLRFFVYMSNNHEEDSGMELPVGRIEVKAEGDLDLAGTLGISREAQVGFSDIRLTFSIEGNLSDEQLASLERKTERYCVVLQTIQSATAVTSTFTSS